MGVENIARLCRIHDIELVKSKLAEMKQEYDGKNSPLMLIDEGADWKLTVREKYLPLVRKIVVDTELSKTIMETLAVIAWKSPVLQSDVIKTRTNKAYDHIAELEASGFISREKHGRTKLIKLTQKFFDYFDLRGKEDIQNKFKSFKEAQATLPIGSSPLLPIGSSPLLPIGSSPLLSDPSESKEPVGAKDETKASAEQPATQTESNAKPNQEVKQEVKQESHEPKPKPRIEIVNEPMEVPSSDSGSGNEPAIQIVDEPMQELQSEDEEEPKVALEVVDIPAKAAVPTGEAESAWEKELAAKHEKVAHEKRSRKHHKPEHHEPEAQKKREG